MARMHIVLRVFETAQILEKAAKHVFAPHGLTAAQFNVMNLLSDQPQGLRASDLAATLIVDPSNVTGLLKRMSRDGLVGNLESREDRRQRIVALTPKGRKLWSVAVKDYDKCLQQLGALLTEKEKRLVEDVMIRLGTKANGLKA